jgi:hypothetical protein
VKKILSITLIMISSSRGPSAEKKTPIVALRGARSFFHNELDPRKLRRLLDAEGPKNTFPELVIKNEYKPYDAYRSTDQPVRVSRWFAFFTCEAI